MTQETLGKRTFQRHNDAPTATFVKTGRRVEIRNHFETPHKMHIPHSMQHFISYIEQYDAAGLKNLITCLLEHKCTSFALGGALKRC